jgi:hypothetical protein
MTVFDAQLKRYQEQHKLAVQHASLLSRNQELKHSVKPNFHPVCIISSSKIILFSISIYFPIYISIYIHLCNSIITFIFCKQNTSKRNCVILLCVPSLIDFFNRTFFYNRITEPNINLHISLHISLHINLHIN